MSYLEANVELQRAALRRLYQRVGELEQRLDAKDVENAQTDGRVSTLEHRADDSEDRHARHVMVMDVYREALSDLLDVERQLGAAGRDELAEAAVGGRDEPDGA